MAPPCPPWPEPAWGRLRPRGHIAPGAAGSLGPGTLGKARCSGELEKLGPAGHARAWVAAFLTSFRAMQTLQSLDHTLSSQAWGCPTDCRSGSKPSWSFKGNILVCRQKSSGTGAQRVTVLWLISTADVARKQSVAEPSLFSSLPPSPDLLAAQKPEIALC